MEKEEVNNIQPEIKRNSKTRLILMVVIGIIIIAIASFLLFYFLQEDEEREIQDDSENTLDSSESSTLIGDTDTTGTETTNTEGTEAGTGGADTGKGGTSTGDTTTNYCETIQAPSLNVICEEFIESKGKYNNCNATITKNGESKGNINYISYEGLTNSNQKIEITLADINYLMLDEHSNRLIIIPHDTLNNKDCTNLEIIFYFNESTILS